MPESKRSRTSDTDVKSDKFATPPRPSLKPYNGNSSAKKHPVGALSHSLQRIKTDMQNAKISHDTTPITVMTFFGERVLSSDPVQTLYGQNKSFLLQKRSEDLLKIITSTVNKIGQILKTPSLNQELLDLCTTKPEAFIECIRSKEIDNLSAFTHGIVLDQSCTIPQDIFRGCKVKLLTKVFDIVNQAIKTNPEWKPTQNSLESLSKEHVISQNLLEQCYNGLHLPHINAQTFDSEALAKRFFNIAISDQIEQQKLQQQCLAQLLHKIFHAKHKEYYQNVDPTVIMVDEEPFNAPHSARVFSHTLLAHRTSALLMADGRVGDEVYSVIKNKHKSHVSSFTYKATNCTVTECNTLFWTGSKTSMLPSLRAYPEIAKRLQAITEIVTDSQIAESILDILCGRAPKIYNDGSLESTKELQFLSSVTHLLFSTEVSRNKSALITNAMFLDLVKSGIYKMSDILNLPMSGEKAVKASRTLSEITIDTLPGHRKYDHSPLQAKPDSAEITTLLTRAEKIYSDWAKLKETDDVPDAIYYSIKDWFGINVDSIVGIQPLDFSAADHAA